MLVLDVNVSRTAQGRERPNNQEQQAQRRGELARVAEIRYGQLRELEAGREAAERELAEMRRFAATEYKLCATETQRIAAKARRLQDEVRRSKGAGVGGPLLRLALKEAVYDLVIERDGAKVVVDEGAIKGETKPLVIFESAEISKVAPD